jgi:Methyltransferase domain
VDRQAWLRERRQTAEERHDAIDAFTYDDQYGEIGPTHRRFVADLLERCPPGGTVLDAACGTGKYVAMILDSGRRVVGTDQSTGMLARARAQFPAVPLERVGLQFYPSRTQVDGWLEQARLVVVAEDHSQGEGHGYLHLLLTPAGRGPGQGRARPGAPAPCRRRRPGRRPAPRPRGSGGPGRAGATRPPGAAAGPGRPGARPAPGSRCRAGG